VDRELEADYARWEALEWQAAAAGGGSDAT